MKANIVALGAALLIAVSASAQTHTPTTVPSEGGMSHCIGVTDEAAWTSLGLKPDQMTRVKAIQAECVKACAAMSAEEKAKMEPGTMDKHEEQIKAVLTSDQYTNWRKWCATKSSTKAEMDKSSKPELKN